MAADEPKKSRRGFACLLPERQRAIARLGGEAAHALGHAHQFDSEEARAAGKKGGEKISQDREHMSRIGQLGGRKRAEQTKERLRNRQQPKDEP